ncbi:hypothetical protein Tsubulata_010945 [Turnera subulata]|uniref:Uncharacterized protein n=1 Tax=Turnera subulata TaxID=218843 RepID=A0A9Q0F6X9_9ROSI|nr:hypothetical protein Tsubulata_010945 [Turnera subulata]
MHYYGRRSNSIFDVFSLNPLPYPVLLLLAVVAIFLGISWFFSYEDMVETAETQLSWVLLVIPLALIVIVRWFMSPWDKRRRTHHIPSEGSSPWGVAALIVLLLVLVQFQSTFLDAWLV